MRSCIFLHFWLPSGFKCRLPNKYANQSFFQNKYKEFDADNNGHFNSCELREALKSLGMFVVLKIFL